MRPTVLISMCLMGVNCRYDGGSNPVPGVSELDGLCTLIPVCLEQLGGLPTPRPPSERRGSRVVTREGSDVTAQFGRGAEQALVLAGRFGARYALLKAEAPPAGRGRSTTAPLPAPASPATGSRLNGCGLRAYKSLTNTISTI